MSVLHRDLRRRAERGAALRQTLYRNELAEQGRARKAGQQAIADAERRIGDLLPMAVQSGITVVDIARLTDVSRPTLYRMIETARSNDAATDLWDQLAMSLHQASVQLGRPALRDEMASYMGITPAELVSRLLIVAPYAAQLGALLASRTDLFESLTRLPKPEGTILNQALVQLSDIATIAASVAGSPEDVTVRLTLGVLRLSSDSLAR